MTLGPWCLVTRSVASETPRIAPASCFPANRSPDRLERCGRSTHCVPFSPLHDHPHYCNCMQICTPRRPISLRRQGRLNEAAGSVYRVRARDAHSAVMRHPTTFTVYFAPHLSQRHDAYQGSPRRIACIRPGRITFIPGTYQKTWLLPLNFDAST